MFMDSMQQFDERKMKEAVMTQRIPSIDQSLHELSNNLTRANILECLRGLHDSKKLSDDEYAHELRSLLKCYNFELDCDTERSNTEGML